jgi:deoxyribonuclease-4
MQVFNQSPRMWRPTSWKPDDVAEFMSLRKGSPVKSVTIHAVYLINPATKDRDMRKKSATSLIHALRMGDEIKADGVVLHPGSAVGEPHDEALPRIGDMVKHALAESDGCRLLLENTAGAGNTLGRSFEELRDLIDLSGGDKRIGVCLDSCHMWASGYDIATADKLSKVVEDFKKTVGIRRLRSLHVNDSQTALGSNRDRHAIPGEGEIGAKGCAAFLSEPAFEKLPALFEGPGTSGHAPDKVDVDTLKELRKKGLATRKRHS